MNTMQKLSIAALVTSASLFSVLSIAKPAMPGGDFGPEMAMDRERGAERFFKALDLTSDQQAQIKALKDAQHQQVDALHDQLDELREQMAQNREPGKFDEAQLRSHLKKVAAVHEELAVQHAKHRQQVWQLLTTDQQQKLTEMLQQRKGKRRHHD